MRHRRFWSRLSSFTFNNLYTNSPKEEMNRIQEAIKSMKQHICSSLTLNVIAEHEQTSTSQFSSIFKNQTGYSPLNYFILLMLKKACRLLSLSGISIKEIAFPLGHSAPYCFSRIFKKTIGASPRQYKNTV